METNNWLHELVEQYPSSAHPQFMEKVIEKVRQTYHEGLGKNTNKAIVDTLLKLKEKTIDLENGDYGDRNYGDAMTDVQVAIDDEIELIK